MHFYNKDFLLNEMVNLKNKTSSQFHNQEYIYLWLDY